MMSAIVLTPPKKRHLLAQKHVVRAIKCENRSSSSTWTCVQEKRTGQSKKSQRCYISLTRREPPTEPICTKICTAVAAPGEIMCAKFWAEIFRGYNFTGGQIFDFFIDSCMGLTPVAVMGRTTQCLKCIFTLVYMLQFSSKKHQHIGIFLPCEHMQGLSWES